jgi:hypothetical protein
MHGLADLRREWKSAPSMPKGKKKSAPLASKPPKRP